MNTKKESDFFYNLALIDNDLSLPFLEKTNVSAPDTSIFTYRFTMKNTHSGEEMGEINCNHCRRCRCSDYWHSITLGTI
jgi:hypothetical protein